MRYKITFELRTNAVLPLVNTKNKELQVRWYNQFFAPIREVISKQYSAFATSVQIANYSIEEIKE